MTSGKTDQRSDPKYGWVVLAASFTALMTFFGLFKSFGLVMMELMTEFGATTAQTTLAFALHAGLLALMAPVGTMLTERYSARAVIFSCTVVHALGYVMCVFATRILHVILAYGVLGGAGFGMIFSPHFILLAQYFEQRRSLAFSISVLGISVGGFIFPPIISYLLERYGYQGAMLIMGGIALHGCVCSSLYCPLPRLEVPEVEDEEEEKLEDKEVHVIRREPTLAPCPEGKMMTTFEAEVVGGGGRGEEALGELLSVPTTPANRLVQELGALSFPSLGASYKSLRELAEIESVFHEFRSQATIAAFPKLSKWERLKEKFPFLDLLKNYSLVAYITSASLQIIGMSALALILPNYVKEASIAPGRESLVISVMMGAEFPGRLLHGFLANRRGYCCRLGYGVCVLVCGVTTAATPLASNLLQVILICAVLGLFGGGLYSVEIASVLETVTVAQFGNALSLLFVCQGVWGMATPTVLGALRDATGSWSVSFIVAGSLLLLGGVVLPLSVAAERLMQRRASQCGEDAAAESLAPASRRESFSIAYVGSIYSINSGSLSYKYKMDV